MNRRLFTIFLTVVMSVATLSASVKDLPVKNINGKSYFYYEVKKGDTVYSLITSLNITRQDLVKYNPSAGELLRAGETLYFPVSEFGDGSETEITTVASGVPVETTSAPAVSGTIAHKVKKGETLYGIGRMYDVDPDLIVDLNPSVRNGVKAGATIYIPVGDPEETELAAEVLPETTPEPEQKLVPTEFEELTADLTPVRPPVQLVEQEEDPTLDESVDSTDIVTRTATVAVLLPFMLDSNEPSKQALHFTDFYKGLLIAADTLSNRGDSLRILAYDTADDITRLMDLLADDNVRSASVIIAPENQTQIAAIASAVSGNTKVLNVFNIRDSLYLTSSPLIQTNVPHSTMFSKAIEAIDQLYADRIPVILNCPNGRNEKAEFVAALADYYRGRGVEPITLTYESALISSQLESLPTEDVRYLIIPPSGSLADFNRFAHTVIRVNASAGESRPFAVFGYPDWTAFRGDTKAALHELDATVYSRFYYDAESFDTECFDKAFERWYGSKPIEVLPDQAILGFDTGNMVIRNLRANDGVFVPSDATYRGVQSSYDFSPVGDGGGWVNSEVYILRFLPDGKVKRIEL